MKVLQALVLAASLLLGSCGGGGGDAVPAAGDGAGVAGAGAGAGGTGIGTGSGVGTGAGAAGPGGGTGGDSGGTASGSDGTAGSGTGGSAGGTGTGSAGGDGTGGTGTAGGGDSGTGAGTGAGTGTAGGGDSGAGTGSGGTGVGDGTGVAGGVGSGGTGVSGDGSGVGSGGTGATASAVGIGSVDGFGSIIVNGVRFDTSQARFNIRDARELQLGMTVRVYGSIAPDLVNGTATLVVSAAQLRGMSADADPANGRFRVAGVVVETDETTVVQGLGGTPPGNGQTLLVWGLPGPDGVLRATRVEATTGEEPIVTSIVRGIQPGAQQFELAGYRVRYSTGALAPLFGQPLRNGKTVTVRGDGSGRGSGELLAGSVEPWMAEPPADGTRLALGGLIADFRGLGDFTVNGVRVDGSRARVNGGPERDLGDGVRVDVAGTVEDGVLVATRIRMRRGNSGR